MRQVEVVEGPAGSVGLHFPDRREVCFIRPVEARQLEYELQARGRGALLRDDLHRQVYEGVRLYPYAFLFTGILALNLGMLLGVIMAATLN